MALLNKCSTSTKPSLAELHDRALPILRLLGFQQAACLEPSGSELLQPFLESLVLKPYSKRTKEAFQKGLTNEDRIAHSFPKWIESKTAGSIRIRSIFECGPATTEKAFNVHAATSPDKFCFMTVDSAL